MAATHSETGRTNAAPEIANPFLVDDVDLRPNALASAIVTSPETWRARRSHGALYQRQFRRTQRRGSLSSQYCRKRFPISRAARREKGRHHSRVAPVFPQFRFDRHALVSVDRRRPHRHLSESARSDEERGANREAQTHVAPCDANFSARLFAQGGAGSTSHLTARHYRGRKTSARLSQRIRGAVQTASI